MQDFRPSEALRQARLLPDESLDLRLRHELDSDNADLVTVGSTQLLAVAKKLIRIRGTRQSYISKNFFSEAGWEMLLALYCADATGHRMTISNLCFASRNPDTTALRWIDRLLSDGFVTRRKHPLDARVVYIELQPSTRAMLRSYLAEVWRTFYS